ncbi:oxaloacetate decarboxylase [Phenylobacterium sp.]|uniref:isocitrate lyase/PEP mutase family protein n=1 Tax=Phenylobacterium sp. TaxID=1871053 RepID=UPI0039835D1B
MSAPAQALRAALASTDGAVLAPGCYDALTASLIERQGFAAAYLSGASIAYSRLGRPDIGLVSASEVAETISLIRDRCPALPLVVDADTGFGNALNVQRTVTTFERAGASAIQFEDQEAPKRCGHLAGKRLVSTGEMTGKIRAAMDARNQSATVIIARTDAIGVEGFEPALERAEAYLQAGPDMLFIEAPRSLSEMRTICARFAGRVPLLVNMVEGGSTPLKDADELGALGYRLVIFPGATARVLVWTLERFFADLKAQKTSAGWSDRMHDLAGLNAVLGTEEILAAGRRYDETVAGAGLSPKLAGKER